MKKIMFSLAVLGSLIWASCGKKDNNLTPTDDFATLEQTVLTDFTNKVAVAGYAELDTKATNFNTAIVNLNTNATEENLSAARDGWKSMRTTWEQCEGFLFGPVEEKDYDPNMDTWPTDYIQLDSLLASGNELSVQDVQGFTLSLRGYHPIEYIIFGDHGNRTAASITARQKKYMVSLSEDLKNTCHALYTSWTSAPTNFAQEVINAGKGSAKYSKRQEVYLAMVEAMKEICEEVGEGKMKEPFSPPNPQLVESPYSGNSIADFKNNIIGLQNVYLGKDGGKGIKDLVKAKNLSLDVDLQNKITAAINSFDNITVPFEDAIFTQTVQLQQTMASLETLKEALENDLKPFIVQYVQD